jgi:hypothetical protein
MSLPKNNHPAPDLGSVEAVAPRGFELRVFPVGETSYGLRLYQYLPGGVKVNGHAPAFVVQVKGDALRVTAEMLLRTLRRAGYKPSDLSRGRRKPFILGEEDGVRLGLLFLALKPLRKLGRMEAITERLKVMETEEAFYWFSKASGRSGKGRAQKALRILLAEE